MESFIQQSGLDWTLVRPPRLTDGLCRNRYRVREGHLPSFGFTISRADVAAFMIKTAENRAFIQKVVGISNLGLQGLKPIFSRFLDVAAKAATHKDNPKNNL